ncbi:MAG: dockerin type I repeat-containing protein [Calditrichia bacterium]
MDSKNQLTLNEARKFVQHFLVWLVLLSATLLAQQKGTATNQTEDIILEPESSEYIQRIQPVPLSELAVQRAQAKHSEDFETLNEINAQQEDQNSEREGEEALGEVVVRESSTIVNYEASSPAPPIPNVWNTDVPVRDLIGLQNQPSMATASDGTIYIAFHISSVVSTNDIVVYKSTTRGLSWDYVIGFSTPDPFVSLASPSLAIGEGTEDRIIVAYEVDSSGDEYIEVATIDMATEQIDDLIVPSQIADWDYVKPVVWTDSPFTGLWDIFIITQAHVLGSATNVNGTLFRSTNFGSSYSRISALGNTSPDKFLDATGAYGRTGLVGGRLYCIAYNETQEQIELVYSDDGGATFSNEAAIEQITPPQGKEVEPQIAGSMDTENVMVTYTSSGGNPTRERLRYLNSTDKGISWNQSTALISNNFDLFQTHLHMNEGGVSWHLTYTRDDGTVRYLSRPQDLSSGWSLPATLVNDTQDASTGGALKSITSDWGSDEAYVAWADNRDGGSDFDIYVDGNFNLGNPTIILGGQSYDDDNNGQSNGNGDGQVNPGETIEWHIDLFNSVNGATEAIGVEVTVEEFSPYVNGFIGDTTINYGNIGVAQQDTNNTPFVFAVDSNVPIGHEIECTITVTALNGGPWTFANIKIPVVQGVGCQGVVRSTVNGPSTHGEGQEEDYSVWIDMRNAASPSDSLGSFTGSMLYDPAVVEYVTASLNSAFVGQINQTPGQIIFNGANANGAGGLIQVLDVTFKAVGSVGNTTLLDLEYSAMAASQTFDNLLPCLNAPIDKLVEIVAGCRLGDVNGDGLCNSTDALILLAYDAGVAISDPGILDLINNGCGDTNGDGLTNSTDALVLLTYDAGLPVPYAVCTQ